YDESSGQLYGQLVTGNSHTRASFVVPATSIYRDICARVQGARPEERHPAPVPAVLDSEAPVEGSTTTMERKTKADRTNDDRDFALAESYTSDWQPEDEYTGKSYTGGWQSQDEDIRRRHIANTMLFEPKVKKNLFG